MARTLFPSIQPAPEVRETNMPLYREQAWDFREARPVFRRGMPVFLEGAEAVRVWAWKALQTQRTRFEIYTWDYGSELETLIGQNYSEELKQAEAARYVREALEVNPYITRVRNIQVGFKDGHLLISAVMDTVYGEVELNV